MNESTPAQFTERVLRRLEEPVRLFGYDLRPDVFWISMLAVVLIAAFAYVAMMYIKDSRSVGPWWATFLGLLRSAVYVLLAFVFLLPAIQTWEQTEVHSKVLMLFDVSGSIYGVIDDIPDDKTPVEKLQTRQDKVLQFLMDEQKAFLTSLEKKNPLTVARFATKLDTNSWYFADGRNWTQLEHEERLNDPERRNEQIEPRPLQHEFWETWLKPMSQTAAPADWSDADKKRYERLVESNQKLATSGFFNQTNLADAVLGMLNRDANSMVQGVIVFTDGRSTLNSTSRIDDLQQRAKSANIPIFVVGIGEERPQVRIEVDSLRMPGQVQPEDKFRVMADVYGEGLQNKEFDIALDVTYSKKGKDGKEELLPITLVEAEDKGRPDKNREEINLGHKVTLKPSAPAKFDQSIPPRAEVEFLVDAAALAEAAGKSLPAGRKFEIGETKEGELRFRARVPKDKLEVFVGKEHVSDATDLHVIKRPLRILLFASAPTRDYQFVRTLMNREVEKKRAELTIHLQLPPGRTERRAGVVQDVPPERLLSEFPDRFDSGTNNPDEKLYDLSEYDIIIAFDPDWSKLSNNQLKLVEKWVDKGGGLIVIGGPINTYQLARPGVERDKLKPILDLYPVVLSDFRIDEMDHKSEISWPLNWEAATPEMEFLKLDEGGEKGPPPFLSDWHEFFFAPDPGGKKPRGSEAVRGFHNYYPSEAAKTGSRVIARFGDPSAKLKNGDQQPFFVISDPNSGRRVIWIASGEMWRLRQYREAFHERFWTKLARYAGAKNQGRLNKHIQLNMGRTFTANRPVEIEATIEGKGGIPLSSSARLPKLTFKLPFGVTDQEFPPEIEMKPKMGQGHEGQFIARVQPKTPGEYHMEVKVPDTGDTESWRFTVKEANPEMDNTRPDFGTMWLLASPAKLVLDRMSDATAKANLRQRLQRPKQQEDEGSAKQAAPLPADETVGEPGLRLYFDLKNADLIPTCITDRHETRNNRGPIQDLWDEGFPLPWLTDSSGQPVKMSWVLTLVVGLLCVEWLTRKLLRLA